MSPSSDAESEVLESVALEPTVLESTVFESTVTLPANLHARPAGKLAQAAGRFASTIRIRHGSKSVNPVGVLAVMSLGATAGSTITVTADGPDAEQAVRTLTEVLSQAE
jgi:phosphotransferase system HPr (HPr) family protein